MPFRPPRIAVPGGHFILVSLSPLAPQPKLHPAAIKARQPERHAFGCTSVTLQPQQVRGAYARPRRHFGRRYSRSFSDLSWCHAFLLSIREISRDAQLNNNTVFIFCQLWCYYRRKKILRCHAVIQGQRHDCISIWTHAACFYFAHRLLEHPAGSRCSRLGNSAFEPGSSQTFGFKFKSLHVTILSLRSLIVNYSLTLVKRVMVASRNMPCYTAGEINSTARCE